MKAPGVAAGALAALLAALLAACGQRNEPAVATVNGAVITQTEAALELRNLLWRGGETWAGLDVEEQDARRKTAVASLVNRLLLAEFAARNTEIPGSRTRQSEDEFEQFLKQFPPPDEWQERMILQGLDEPALRKKVGEEVRRLDAVENWLAQQPGKVTEADARRWFRANTKELTVPERVRASHIFLTRHDPDKPDREPEIRELHRKLTTREATFEELAAKNSDDESAKLRAGDLGWFSRQRVPPEFATRVFALPVGEMSAPFESHLGWHILLVKEKQPPRAATFEEMKDEITGLLETRWREAAIQRLVEDLRSRARIERFPDRITVISPE